MNGLTAHQFEGEHPSYAQKELLGDRKSKISNPKYVSLSQNSIKIVTEEKICIEREKSSFNYNKQSLGELLPAKESSIESILNIDIGINSYKICRSNFSSSPDITCETVKDKEVWKNAFDDNETFTFKNDFDTDLFEDHLSSRNFPTNLITLIKRLRTSLNMFHFHRSSIYRHGDMIKADLQSTKLFLKSIQLILKNENGDTDMLKETMLMIKSEIEMMRTNMENLITDQKILQKDTKHTKVSLDNFQKAWKMKSTGYKGINSNIEYIQSNINCIECDLELMSKAASGIAILIQDTADQIDSALFKVFNKSSIKTTNKKLLYVQSHTKRLEGIVSNLKQKIESVHNDLFLILKMVSIDCKENFPKNSAYPEAQIQPCPVCSNKDEEQQENSDSNSVLEKNDSKAMGQTSIEQSSYSLEKIHTIEFYQPFLMATNASERNLIKNISNVLKKKENYDFNAIAKANEAKKRILIDRSNKIKQNRSTSNLRDKRKIRIIDSDLNIRKGIDYPKEEEEISDSDNQNIIVYSNPYSNDNLYSTDSSSNFKATYKVKSQNDLYAFFEKNLFDAKITDLAKNSGISEEKDDEKAGFTSISNIIDSMQEMLSGNLKRMYTYNRNLVKLFKIIHSPMLTVQIAMGPNSNQEEVENALKSIKVGIGNIDKGIQATQGDINLIQLKIKVFNSTIESRVPDNSIISQETKTMGTYIEILKANLEFLKTGLATADKDVEKINEYMEQEVMNSASINKDIKILKKDCQHVQSYLNMIIRDMNVINDNICKIQAELTENMSSENNVLFDLRRSYDNLQQNNSRGNYQDSFFDSINEGSLKNVRIFSQNMDKLSLETMAENFPKSKSTTETKPYDSIEDITLIDSPVVVNCPPIEADQGNIDLFPPPICQSEGFNCICKPLNSVKDNIDSILKDVMGINSSLKNFNPDLNLIQSDVNNIQPNVKAVSKDLEIIRIHMDAIREEMTTINENISYSSLKKSQLNIASIPGDLITIQANLESIYEDLNLLKPDLDTLHVATNGFQYGMKTVRNEIANMYLDLENLRASLNQVHKKNDKPVEMENINSEIELFRMDLDSAHIDIETFHNNLETFHPDLEIIEWEMEFMQWEMENVRQDVETVRVDMETLFLDVEDARGDPTIVLNEIEDIKKDLSVIQEDIAIIKPDLQAVHHDLMIFKPGMESIQNDIESISLDIKNIRKRVQNLNAQILIIKENCE